MPQTFDLNSARGRRALIISMCQRRQRPGTGSDLRTLMQRGLTMNWPDLSQALDAVPWAVIGAVATRLYMPERATADLDIMVSEGDLARAEQRLAGAGWHRTGDLAIGGSAWRGPGGTQLDVVVCAEPWCSDALREALTNRDEQGLPILPLPYLILLKLGASRTTDIGDVSRMLGLADDAALAVVRTTIERYTPEDLDDLESLIALGKLETEGA